MTARGNGPESSDADLRCDQFVELVTGYLEGTLGPELTSRVERSLARCEGCATYLDQMRKTMSALGAPPAEALPEDVRDRLLAAFRDANSRD